MNLKCLRFCAFLNGVFKRCFAPYFKRLILNDVLHHQNTKRDTALDNLYVLELYYRYIIQLIFVDANNYSSTVVQAF